MSLNTLFRWKRAWENRQQKATFINHRIENPERFSTYFFDLKEVQFNLGTTTEDFHNYLQFLFLIIYFLNITNELGERAVNNFDCFINEEGFAECFSGLGALVYLLLLAVCALAVLTYFARRGREGEPFWIVVVSPLLALAGLGFSAWITAKNFPLLVGDVDAAGNPVFGALSGALLALVAVTAGAGVVLALVLRARGARAYDEITEARITV